MSDMSWEHASEARAALNAIVTDPEHGVGALSNPQTMSNLLKDYLPDAPREKSILVAAAEAGLADTLRDHVAQGMDPNTAIRLTASSFSSSTPFTPEACNWVTDEIAVALGISQPRRPGSGLAGGGAAAGAGASGSEGMPTRIVPIPGAAGAAAAPAAAGAPGAGGAPGGFQQGQPANQAPGQGYPQAPPQGFGQPGQPGPQDQAGYRPGYAPGPQVGGFAQPQGQGYPGQQPQPQPQPYQAQRFPGQPVQPYPGQQQPQPYQPGRGYPGQPGYVQPGQPGAPAGWGPGAGYGPGGAPPKPTGGRRGLLVVGGIVVLIIIVIVAAVVLSKKPHKHNPTGGGSPTASVTPSTSPTSTPTTTGGVEPLSTIMNPAGLSPVGTDCGNPVLNGLKASTLIASTFCRKTTFKNVQVWGYQFDSHADYLAGVAHINSFTGFKRTSVNTTCNPPVQGTDGLSPWHANSNPKYVARAGQVLECFIDNNYPLIIWTMPTMNVFFIGRDYSKADQITRLVTWWTKVNYG
ncbi:MAG TPA: hypothetical protein VEV63_14235 [Streptosporangiaceae bacterium]|nr:hypothetical protein [Streptosporangiaceae bacterium]